MNSSNKFLEKLSNIPRSIWVLGIVSLFMDTSSELIHSLLPIFMVTTLGVSVTAVGIVEGVAESTALIVKLFSGVLSDYFRQRKTLTMIGYGLAAITKPLFPLANSIALVMVARFIDRIGKGIRGAPRDAMVGDLAPPEIRGACFGLRQSLDTIGAFLGPLIAICGMLFFSQNLRVVLWIAVIPAVFSFIILAVGVKEPKFHQDEQSKERLNFRECRNLGSEFWKLIIIASVYTLARFSDAFLILKAQATGLPIILVPLVMILMNIIYAFFAYPAGILSDYLKRKTVFLIGISFLIAANIVFGFTHNLWMLTLGISLWGLHLAFTQGLLATMVTDTSAPHMRGTAYGIFNFVCGIVMLISSIIAGLLWDHFGSSYTFFAGAIFTAIAFVGMLLELMPKMSNPRK